MNRKDLEILIQGLEFVQFRIEAERRDYNGDLLKRREIDELQKAIDVLKILLMELPEEE